MPSSHPVLITHLEMHEPPGAPAPVLPAGITIERVIKPAVDYYRFLYNAVGSDWQWTDRNRLSDDELARIVQDERVAIHVLYVEGEPAGYVELDGRVAGEVQIAYFGLFPGFTERGLGTVFLTWAIHEAWKSRPRRVHVNTCTLDHPAALPLYQKFGFRPFKTEMRGS